MTATQATKLPRYKMDGQDGNAFYLIAGWRKAARLAGCTIAEIERVTTEAENGDYDNVLQVLLRNSR